MNEKAIQDAYKLFKGSGYSKSIDEFKELIKTNENALSDAYKLFSNSGYSKSIDDFKVLMGVTTPSKKKDTTESSLEDGSLVLPESYSEQDPLLTPYLTPEREEFLRAVAEEQGVEYVPPKPPKISDVEVTPYAEQDIQPADQTRVEKLYMPMEEEQSARAPEGIKRTAEVKLPQYDSPSTVLMAHYGDYSPPEAKGKYVAFPTIFPKDPNNQTSNIKDWIIAKNEDEAYEIAKQRGEVLYYDTQEEAASVAAGSWKSSWMSDAEQDIQPSDGDGRLVGAEEFEILANPIREDLIAQLKANKAGNLNYREQEEAVKLYREGAFTDEELDEQIRLANRNNLPLYDYQIEYVYNKATSEVPVLDAMDLRVYNVVEQAEQRLQQLKEVDQRIEKEEAEVSERLKKQEEAAEAERLASLEGIDEDLSFLSSDFLSQSEETVVPELNKKLGKYGIAFSKAIVGTNAVKMVSSTGEPETIGFGNTESQRAYAIERIKSFVKKGGKKPRELTNIQKEASDYVRSQGFDFDYNQQIEIAEAYEELEEDLNFIEQGISYSLLTKEEKERFGKYYSGNYISVSKEIKSKMLKKLSVLEEQFNKSNFFSENNYRRARNEYDEYIEKKLKSISASAARTNDAVQASINNLEQTSQEVFGVSLNELQKIKPKNQEEARIMMDIGLALEKAKQDYQNAAILYESANTYYDAKVEKKLQVELADNLEAITESYTSALNTNRAGRYLLYFQLGLPMDTPLEEVAGYIEKAQNAKVGRALWAFQNAKTMAGKMEVFKNDPFEMIASVGVQMIGQMRPYWKEIVATTAGGAAIGSATGTPFGIVGGGIQGFRISQAAINAAVEYTNVALDAMRKYGYNPADAKSLDKAINDSRVWDEANDVGLKRAAIIMGVDYLSGGAAGRIVKVGTVASRGRKIAAKVGEALVYQPFEEGLGEYLAQVGSGQDVNWTEIQLEAMGGPFVSTPMMVLNTYFDSKRETNIEIAKNLMDIDFISKEISSNSRISTWANNMERLGRISPEQNQIIQENVGLREEARDLLGVGMSTRFKPKKTIALESRVMKLLSAREQLSSTANRRSVFSKKISEINSELEDIVTTKKLRDKDGETNLDIAGMPLDKGKRVGLYKIKGKEVSKQEFLDKVRTTPVEELDALNPEVRNDTESKSILNEILTGGLKSVQEQFQELDNTERQRFIDEADGDEATAINLFQKSIRENLFDDANKISDNLFLREQGDTKRENQQRDRITTIATNAAKSISNLLPQVKIVMHNSAQDFNNVTNRRGAGFFSFDDNTIHVNLEDANLRTVPHEVFHAVLFNKLGEEGVASSISNMVSSVRRGLPKNSKIYKRVDEFARMYEEDEAFVQDEERMSELFGIMSSEYKKLSKPSKNAIIKFIQDIARKFGILDVITDTDEAVIDLMNTLSEKVRKGEELVEGDVKTLEELDNGTNPIGEPTTIRKTKEGGRESKNTFKESHKYSLITPDKSFDFMSLINDIADKKQKVWFWVADQLGIDKELGIDAGPSFAYQKEGDIWASSVPVNEIQESIDKSDYLFIISGAPDKSHMFNKVVFDRYVESINMDYNEFKDRILSVEPPKAFVEVLEAHDSWDSLREDGSTDYTPTKEKAIEALKKDGIKSPSSSQIAEYRESKTRIGTGRKKFLIAHNLQGERTMRAPYKKAFIEMGREFLDPNTFRDGFYVDNDFKQNDVMLVLKPTGVREGSNHSTYENTVTGDVVGVPDVKVDALELMPVEMREKYQGKRSKASQSIAPYGKGIKEIESPTGREQRSRIEDATENGQRIVTDSDITLFRGTKPKMKNGKPFSVHKIKKGKFAALDRKISLGYKGDKPLKIFEIPSGTTVEVVRLPTGQGVEGFRRNEENAIDASDAQVVKLITYDASGKEDQYIIKDDDLLAAVRDETPQEEQEQSQRMAETPRGRGQRSTPRLVRDMDVLLTPATVRGMNPMTERIKALSIKYNDVVKEFQSNGDENLLPIITELEEQILNEPKQEIIDKVSEMSGVAVKFGPAQMGLWDGMYEPSFSMTLSVTPQANTKKLSNLLNGFAEKYSQDAYILDMESIKDEQYRNGELDRLPMQEDVSEGVVDYPQIYYTFVDALSDDQVLELSDELSASGIPAFTIDNNELKISVLPFKETYEEKREIYEQQKTESTKAIERISKGDGIVQAAVRIRRSSYIGSRNDGDSQKTSRPYNKRDVFKPFKKLSTKVEESAKELAAIRREQIRLSKKKQSLSPEKQKRYNELTSVVQPTMERTFALNKKLYEEANREIIDIARNASTSIKYHISKFPIKRPSRASVKTIRWYDSLTQKLGDGARVSIIADEESNAKKLFDNINKSNPPTRGLRRETETTELGYPKKLIEIKTSNGVIAEIQVMTPEAILAKEDVFKHISPDNRDRYIELLNKTRDRLGFDIPHGLGHYFYEIHRDLNVTEELRDEAKRLSNIYYDAFLNDKSSLDESFMDDVIKFKENVDKADKTTWDSGNDGKSPQTLNDYISGGPRGKEQKGKVVTDAQLKQLKNAIIELGRANGLSDASIREVLKSRGFKAADINQALEYRVDLFTAMPREFERIEGGIQQASKLFNDLRTELNKWSTSGRPNIIGKRRVKTFAEIRQKAMELMKEHPIYQAQNDQVQMEIMSAFDRSLGYRANPSVQKEISALRNNLRQRKIGEKNLREAQIRLKNFIRNSLPKSKIYTQAQVNRLTKMITESNLDNFEAQALKVMEIVEQQREKIRKVRLKEIYNIVKTKARPAMTKTGKRRAAGLDAIGQETFAAIKPVMDAVLKNDLEALEKINAFLNENANEINEAIDNYTRGEQLTTKEKRLLAQQLAYDSFAELSTASLEEVELLLSEVKKAKKESILRFKTRRLKRAADAKAVADLVTEQIEKTNPALFDENGNVLDVNERDDVADNIRESLQKFKLKEAYQQIRGSFFKTKAGQQITAFKNWFRHLGTLTNLLDKVTEGKTMFTDYIYRRLNRADEMYNAGLFETKEKLNNIAKQAGIDGGMRGVDMLLHGIGLQQLQVIRSKTGRERLTYLNGDQLLRIYALSKNPIQAQKLAAQGITEEVISDIATILGPELTTYADGVVDFLSNEYYEGVNQVYAAVNNVNLGFVENYFPTRTVQSKVNSKLLDDGDFNGIFNAETSPAFKERVDQKSDIQLKAGDFTSILNDHIQTMEKYKAFAETSQQLNDFFRVEAVDALLDVTGLKKAVKGAINFAINPMAGKNASGLESGILESIQNKFTSFALAFKLVQIPKQASSFINAYEEYSYFPPNSKVPKVVQSAVDPVMFMVDGARVLGSMALDLVGKDGAIHQAMEMSATFRKRIEQGLEGDVYGLESGSQTFKPLDKSMSKVARARRALRTGAAAPTVIGDVMGVMGYMINYKRNIANGMSKAEALEAFNNYNATQQSRRGTDKIPLQYSNNALVRGFTMFGSTLFLQINKVMSSATNMSSSISEGKMPRKQDIRAFYLNLAIANVLFVGISNIMMFIKGDDEDREAALDKMRDAMLGLNLLYQIPYAGAMFESLDLGERLEALIAGKEYKKKRKMVDDVVNPFTSISYKVNRLMKEDGWTGVIRPIAELVMGVQLDPFIGMFNKAMKPEDLLEFDDNMYDILGISKSYRPEDYSDEDYSDEEFSDEEFSDEEFSDEDF